MLDEVVAALDLQPGMRVLDAGCGTGDLEARLAERHPGVEVVALDASTAMLARARRRQAWPAGTRRRGHRRLFGQTRRALRPRGECQPDLGAG